jgi:hypothetical protein
VAIISRQLERGKKGRESFLGASTVQKLFRLLDPGIILHFLKSQKSADVIYINCKLI